MSFSASRISPIDLFMLLGRKRAVTPVGGDLEAAKY